MRVCAGTLLSVSEGDVFHPRIRVLLYVEGGCTMQTNRQELLSSVTRRLRRGKKATGRIVVSALGFALAYYFDPENGELRRKQLHQTVQRAFRTLNEAAVSNAGDPPPVFPSLLRPPRPESDLHPST